MYIIIEQECIDTSSFTKMKLYGKAGIIAFTHCNKSDGTEFDVPIIFDDTFDACLIYDAIIDRLSAGDYSCFVTVRATVPTWLLARIKRETYMNPNPDNETNLD